MNDRKRTASIMQDVNSGNINGFKEKGIRIKKSPCLNNYSKAMRICCINMRQKEESRLPNLFTVSGYKDKKRRLYCVRQRQSDSKV